MTDTTELTTLACAKCRATFAVTRQHYFQLKKSGETFYCPNGHGNVFTPPSEEDELGRVKNELEAARTENARQASRLESWRRSSEMWQETANKYREVAHGLHGDLLIPQGLRGRFALNQAELWTLEQLAEKTDEELLAIHQIGEGTVAEIKRLLVEHRLILEA